jgi:hypothetical protein
MAARQSAFGADTFGTIGFLMASFFLAQPSLIATNLGIRLYVFASLRLSSAWLRCNPFVRIPPALALKFFREHPLAE